MSHLLDGSFKFAVTKGEPVRPVLLNTGDRALVLTVEVSGERTEDYRALTGAPGGKSGASAGAADAGSSALLIIPVAGADSWPKPNEPGDTWPANWVLEIRGISHL